MYDLWMFYVGFMRLTMHINLSPEIEQYLQSKLSSGLYGNTSEVIRDAIRRMKAEDEKLNALKTAVQLGDAQLELGEGIPYAQERLEAITEKAYANSRLGKPVNPDVAP
jgi:antitoxin ParD1/3/4